MQPIDLIKKLGGTFAVAELASVKPPSVSEWKTNNRIPDDKLIRLAPIAEARGIATRKELFPNDWHEIWPEIANQSYTPSGNGNDIVRQASAPLTTDPALDADLKSAAQAGLVVLPKKTSTRNTEEERRVAEEQRRAEDRDRDAQLKAFKDTKNGA